MKVALCFFLATFVVVASGLNSLNHESIVQLLLPTLKSYEDMLKNPALYTDKVRQELKRDVHSDLVDLKQTLSDENDFAELEKVLYGIIDNPEEVVAVVDELSKHYSDNE